MKKSIFVKISKFSLILGLILGLNTFIGCQKEDISSSKYSQHLTLDNGTDFSKLSKNDYEIIGKALERVKISKEGSTYKISQSSVSELNISNELFDYITKLVSTTNGLRWTMKSAQNSNRLLNVRFKTPPEPGAAAPNNCVAKAIGRAGCTTYDTANDSIVSRYGTEGVPLEDFIEVCSIFCTNGKEVQAKDIKDGPLNNMIIVIEKSPGEFHAVNGTFNNGSGDIVYFDAQSNQPGYCQLSDVKLAFSPQ